MEIRNPSETELEDLIGQISAAFLYKEGEGGVATDFPQLYDPSNSKNLWAAFEGPRVVGHAGFYPAEMKVEGLALPVAGIGGVFSDPKNKGQGIGSTLVNKCVDQAKKQGCALAFLWSDKHEFYGKLGFHLVGRQWTITLDPKHIPALTARGNKNGLLADALRFVAGDVSGAFLADSYDLQERLPLGIARSRAEHAILLASGACTIFSAWAGDDLAAYFVIGKGKDLPNYVHEWAGDESALHHLAAHVLGLANRPLQVLSPQFMPDEVNWIYSLDEIGVPLRPEQMSFVKILDFNKVKRLVMDYMNRMGLKAEDLSLATAGGRYQVIWRGGPPMEFSEEAFLLFLFGPEMPAHQELKAFLPLRLWYWGMDSV
jgi:GNAT superfamily N-acetyltransferase